MKGRTPGKASKLEERRRRAVEMVEKDELSQVEVARRLKVDPRSVRRWMEWHRGRGVRKLAARATPGRPSRLSAVDRKKLESILLKGPREAGYDTDLWSCVRVGKVIEKEFGVKYHVDYISQLLRKMGWSPQKPEKRAIERDEAKILGWRRRTWSRIKKKAQLTGATIAFIDECGVLMAPVTRRTWAPTGKTPILRQVGRSHTKVSVIGAICARPGRRDQAKVKAFFRLYPKQNIDAARCREFLRQLLGNINGPVIVVWDRLNAHRSVKVRKFVESTNGKLSLEYFPAYAPELNPIEYGWGYLKGRVLANHAPKDADELLKATKQGICLTRRRRSVLLGCIAHAPISFFD